MLTYLMWQIDQHTRDPGSNSQRILLALLQCKQRFRLLHLRLLDSELRGDCLLIQVEPLLLKMIAFV